MKSDPYYVAFYTEHSCIFLWALSEISIKVSIFNPCATITLTRKVVIEPISIDEPSTTKAISATLFKISTIYCLASKSRNLNDEYSSVFLMRNNDCIPAS